MPDPAGSDTPKGGPNSRGTESVNPIERAAHERKQRLREAEEENRKTVARSIEGRRGTVWLDPSEFERDKAMVNRGLQYRIRAEDEAFTRRSEDREREREEERKRKEAERKRRVAKARAAQAPPPPPPAMPSSADLDKKLDDFLNLPPPDFSELFAIQEREIRGSAPVVPPKPRPYSIITRRVALKPAIPGQPAVLTYSVVKTPDMTLLTEPGKVAIFAALLQIISPGLLPPKAKEFARAINKKFGRRLLARIPVKKFEAMQTTEMFSFDVDKQLLKDVNQLTPVPQRLFDMLDWKDSGQKGKKVENLWKPLIPVYTPIAARAYVVEAMLRDAKKSPFAKRGPCYPGEIYPSGQMFLSYTAWANVEWWVRPDLLPVEVNVRDLMIESFRQGVMKAAGAVALAYAMLSTATFFIGGGASVVNIARLGKLLVRAPGQAAKTILHTVKTRPLSLIADMGLEVGFNVAFGDIGSFDDLLKFFQSPEGALALLETLAGNAKLGGLKVPKGSVPGPSITPTPKGPQDALKRIVEPPTPKGPKVDLRPSKPGTVTTSPAPKPTPKAPAPRPKPSAPKTHVPKVEAKKKPAKAKPKAKPKPKQTAKPRPKKPVQDPPGTARKKTDDKSRGAEKPKKKTDETGTPKKSRTEDITTTVNEDTRQDLIAFWERKLAEVSGTGKKERRLRSRYERYLRKVRNKERPEWRQSEMEIEYLYGTIGGSQQQKAFKHGRAAPAGGKKAKGSTRPDAVHSTTTVEIKNYNLKDDKGLSSAAKSAAKQVKDRRKHQPANIKQQTVVVDIRGQNIDPKRIPKIRKVFAEKTGLPPENIQILRWSGD